MKTILNERFDGFSMTPAKPRPTYRRENDGVDHINVHAKAATELGRMLGHYARTPFTHPEHGYFACMEAFWWWRKSLEKPDSIRTLSGHEAKQAGTKLAVVRLDNFHREIRDANYYKIIQHGILHDLFVESVLPFTNYYYRAEDDTVVEMPNLHWVVDGLEDIRTQLQYQALTKLVE